MRQQAFITAYLLHIDEAFYLVRGQEQQMLTFLLTAQNLTAHSPIIFDPILRLIKALLALF
jgi:hypothetical protein